MNRSVACLLIFTGTLFSISTLFAQEQASVTWPFNSDLNPDITGGAEAGLPAYSEAMKFYDFTDLPDAEGTQHTTAAIQTVSQEWIAASRPVDSLYFQFSVSPKEGGTLYPDSLSMYIGGWFSSNLRAEIYSSADSAFSTKDTLVADTSLSGDEVLKVGAALEDTVETGEMLYIRVYPYNTESEGWAKLVAVDSVTISGVVTGVTADPPSVATYNAERISTTTAIAGGSVSSDGGAEVTARGVVWNTEGSPDIDDEKTTDGTGTGSFESRLTGLSPGTTYYLRAYATNESGTAYGREIDLTTLDARSTPAVTTASVSGVLAEIAESGGEVTDWGGAEVEARGVVWNTSGNPTLEDNYTEDGAGPGSFASTLYPLNSETQYYVRAYATNSEGTGYGFTRTFTTQPRQRDITKIVAQDGSGDYTSVQAAFDDIPDMYTGTYTIFVKKGEYYEKLFLEEEKVNVRLIGEHRDSTVLYYDDYAGIAGGTSQSYSVSIDADDFIAKDITFQNTVKNDKSVSDQQAVALSTNGDRQAYYNVNILGYQDTYYARGSHGTGRIYMKNAYIEGSVDFIFGRNIVVFDSSQIHINRDGGTLTAAATEPESSFGFVFTDSRITADSIGFDGDRITEFYLGRPWQAAPRTVFLNTYYPASLAPEGWLSWNVSPARYAEYNCSGPGCINLDNRASFAEQLSDEQASAYTLQNIFSKESNPLFGRDWMPKQTVAPVSNEGTGATIPSDYKLRQNYPNPFNPSTTIGYSLPQPGKVQIQLFDLLGRKVATIVNRHMEAGHHEVVFDAPGLSSGVYFYRIKASNYTEVKKMTLVK